MTNCSNLSKLTTDLIIAEYYSNLMTIIDFNLMTIIDFNLMTIIDFNLMSTIDFNHLVSISDYLSNCL